MAAAASLVVLIALGLLSYFLAQQAERMARPSAPRAVTHEPDYFVDRLRLLKANASGDPAVRIEAVRMRHFPDDLTIEFDHPHIVTLTDDQPAIRITAIEGNAPDTGEKTDLRGDVRIVRDADAHGPAVVVLTQAATILLDEKVIVTDQPVEIDMGPNRLTGVGMRMDSQTRRLQVDSRVKGFIAPRDGAPGAAPGQPAGSGR